MSPSWRTDVVSDMELCPDYSVLRKKMYKWDGCAGELAVRIAICGTGSSPGSSAGAGRRTGRTRHSGALRLRRTIPCNSG